MGPPQHCNAIIVLTSVNDSLTFGADENYQTVIVLPWRDAGNIVRPPVLQMYRRGSDTRERGDLTDRRHARAYCGGLAETVACESVRPDAIPVCGY